MSVITLLKSPADRKCEGLQEIRQDYDNTMEEWMAVEKNGQSSDKMSSVRLPKSCAWLHAKVYVYTDHTQDWCRVWTGLKLLYGQQTNTRISYFNGSVWCVIWQTEFWTHTTVRALQHGTQCSQTSHRLPAHLPIKPTEHIEWRNSLPCTPVGVAPANHHKEGQMHILFVLQNHQILPVPVTPLLPNCHSTSAFFICVMISFRLHSLCSSKWHDDCKDSSVSCSTWSVQKETELVKYGANEPTQVTRDSGAV
jgi:hypothetical protein